MKLFFSICCTICFLSILLCCKKKEIPEPELDPRDSIIGIYDGKTHYFDQNNMMGNEIDTMYPETYEVIKFGKDSIKITPPLPIYYPEIANEYFKNDPGNVYSDYYSTTYTGYSLNLEFKPDSSLLVFSTYFSVGIAYDNHSYKFRGFH